MFKRSKKNKEVMQEEPQEKKKKGSPIKKILLIVVVLMMAAMLILSKFGSKGGEVVPDKDSEESIAEELSKSPVPLSVITADLENIINKDEELDEIVVKNISVEEFSKKHKDIIDAKVSGNAKPYLIHVDGIGRSPSYDMNFSYELLYVEISKDWHLLHSGPLNEDDWEYSPTESVRPHRVRETLQELIFDGFEEGFIGDMETSDVVIEHSQTELDKKKDIVDIKIEVQTDFATYVLKEEVEYVYKKNEWVIKDKHKIANSKKWDIKYLTDTEPQSHSKEFVMGLVSNEGSYFSKVINLENAKNYTLNNPEHIPNQYGIGLKYGLNVEYEDLSVITYNITIPVEWTGASWVDKDVSISIGSAIFNNMLGIWFSKDTGDIIILEDVKPFMDDAGVSLQKISGKMFEKNMDLSLKEYELEITPEIPLRAEAFAGKFGEMKGSLLSDRDIVFNINESHLESAGKVFIKADKLLGYNKDVDIDKLLNGNSENLDEELEELEERESKSDQEDEDKDEEVDEETDEETDEEVDEEKKDKKKKDEVKNKEDSKEEKKDKKKKQTDKDSKEEKSKNDKDKSKEKDSEETEEDKDQEEE